MLPDLPPPATTVDLEGHVVPIRSLTVAEAVEARRLLDGDETAGMAWVIGCGTDTPTEDVQVWLKNTSGKPAFRLFMAIRDLTGLDDDAPKSG